MPSEKCKLIQNIVLIAFPFVFNSQNVAYKAKYSNMKIPFIITTQKSGTLRLVMRALVQTWWLKSVQLV